jgi:hypothetical protein
MPLDFGKYSNAESIEFWHNIGGKFLGAITLMLRISLHSG